MIRNETGFDPRTAPTLFPALAAAPSLSLWNTVPDALPVSSIPAVNVATVPQRSPLRYPGGKTWLVPHIRQWLGDRGDPAPVLVEPFAGGAIVSLTAVMEGLARRCVMAEIDPDVAAFWRAALQSPAELAERVRSFVPTHEKVAVLAARDARATMERAFRTLVLNRTRRGGILANGASVSRVGENGKGILSRWYPETICRRLQSIGEHAGNIQFREGDGLEILSTTLNQLGEDAVAFVDPPYSAGGKRAGTRLYNYCDIDHARLFEILADCRSDFLMTYDLAPEIEVLVRRHGFHAVQVLMKNTHHNRVSEVVITRRPVFSS